MVKSSCAETCSSSQSTNSENPVQDSSEANQLKLKLKKLKQKLKNLKQKLRKCSERCRRQTSTKEKTGHSQAEKEPELVNATLQTTDVVRAARRQATKKAQKLAAKIQAKEEKQAMMWATKQEAGPPHKGPFLEIGNAPCLGRTMVQVPLLNITIFKCPDNIVKGHRGAGAVILADGTKMTTLVSHAPTEFGKFGKKITVVGQRTLVISATGEIVKSQKYAGAVYLYDMKKKCDMTRLVSHGPMMDAFFGSKITVVGNHTLVISEPGETVKGQSGAGAVYLYDMKKKGKMTRLVSDTPTRYGCFGSKVTVVGDHTLVISAPQDKVKGQGSAGAVYLYDMKKKGKKTRLVNPTPIDGSRFGSGVKVQDNDRLVLISGAGIPAAVIDMSEPERYIHCRP